MFSAIYFSFIVTQGGPPNPAPSLFLFAVTPICFGLSTCKTICGTSVSTFCGIIACSQWRLCICEPAKHNAVDLFQYFIDCHLKFNFLCLINLFGSVRTCSVYCVNFRIQRLFFFIFAFVNWSQNRPRSATLHFSPFLRFDRHYDDTWKNQEFFSPLLRHLRCAQNALRNLQELVKELRFQMGQNSSFFDCHSKASPFNARGSHILANLNEFLWRVQSLSNSLHQDTAAIISSTVIEGLKMAGFLGCSYRLKQGGL